MIDTTEALGHVAPEGPHLRTHLLDLHLREVARLAGEFAVSFGAKEWARLAGLWHDLGKYRPSFQAKLRAAGGIDAHIEGAAQRVTHSHAGALHAINMLGASYGEILAYLIAGHHAGLPDRHSCDGAAASLHERLKGVFATDEYKEAFAQPIPADILAKPERTPGIAADAEGFALWVRMLFSCLVDADFLDTEAFFDPAKAAKRGCYPTIGQLKRVFDISMSEKEQAVRVSGESPVNRLRADVLAQCRAKGVSKDLKPGFFSLTVPTGGGKTLSSLAFALDHAAAHGKRRVIYAIPYTSIIEQTAKVFGEVFASLGEDCVVEHHSNLDVREDREDHANRLATENWDAPLIVTTNVQLFESLYAARTSRCRKLHNLADSIIVLDEAQQLPRDFLAPVMRVLKQLVSRYGVTVVLCTATQPALHTRRDAFGRITLDGIEIESLRPIIETPQPLFDAMRRVDVHLPADFRIATPWSEIAQRLLEQECVLAIVSARKHARDLSRLLPTEGSEHLSALMCAEHRSAVVARIRRRLQDRLDGKDSMPLRVVSTQLVEAGVDLDFPVVYRALAGLDSIAQAAGRCNREGRLAGRGQMHVFVPETMPPPGLLRQGAMITREMAFNNELADPLSPDTFIRYFSQFYAHDANGFDREKVLELLHPSRAAFRTAAQKFRLIDDDGESIIVPYRQEGEEQSPIYVWLNMLAKNEKKAGWARRKLQRYTVGVPQSIFAQLLKNGDVEEKAGLWVALRSRYDTIYGLMLPEDHGNIVDHII